MTADQWSWLRAGVSVVAYLAACLGLDQPYAALWD